MKLHISILFGNSCANNTNWLSRLDWSQRRKNRRSRSPRIINSTLRCQCANPRTFWRRTDCTNLDSYLDWGRRGARWPRSLSPWWRSWHAARRGARLAEKESEEDVRWRLKRFTNPYILVWLSVWSYSSSLSLLCAGRGYRCTMRCSHLKTLFGRFTKVTLVNTW